MMSNENLMKDIKNYEDKMKIKREKKYGEKIYIEKRNTDDKKECKEKKEKDIMIKKEGKEKNRIWKNSKTFLLQMTQKSKG